MSVFDTDVSFLKHLVIEDRPMRQREISEFLTENVTKKFCSLCSHFNIDHLDLSPSCDPPAHVQEPR
jgi:hypothetical protein